MSVNLRANAGLSRSTRAGRVRNAVLFVVALTVTANVVVWLVATAFGVDFEVAPQDRAAMTVGLEAVVVMTLGPIVLGGVLAMLLTRKYWWSVTVLAWVGLAVGLLTVAMPFGVQAELGTQCALASMHVIPGFVWWLALGRASRGTS